MNEKLKFSTVDEYINAQAEHSRVVLTQIRQIIKNAVPDAQELISYSMPAFKYHGMLAFYAAFKNHHGLYIPSVLSRFEEELKGFEVSKATIRLPFDKEIPEKLITEIVKCAAQTNLERKALKEVIKKRKN